MLFESNDNSIEHEHSLLYQSYQFYTCSHICNILNFLNLAAGWHVERKVQHDKQFELH
jgi:hypothetical protein